MKRELCVCAVVLAAAVPAWAGHGGTFQVSGQIAAPAYGAVSDNTLPCDASSPLQGIDAFWIPLPDGVQGHTAELLPASAYDDLDAYFWDGDCALIGDDSMARASLGEAEGGTVPDDAAWAEVDLFAGAVASFTFTVRASG